MKKGLYFAMVFLMGAVLFGGGILIGNKLWKQKEETLPEPTPVPTPYAGYMVKNLADTKQDSGEIKIERELARGDVFASYLFSHEFSPAPYEDKKKRVTGLLNIPDGEEKFPAILMIRGYVDQESYVTGAGTWKAGEELARNGYITIAPDYLGYGESDRESENIFEARFQTYTTTMSVINSLNSIDQWDRENIGIWAHSNGGQIALTILSATGASYPTVLWAPVTKQFPYNVFYYLDEADDGGKLIRKELAKLEEIYEVSEFSFDNYLDRLNARILLHQGTADDAVPADWSDSFVWRLEKLKKEVEYKKYVGADHNMKPVWNEVVLHDIEFYNEYLK